MRVYISHPYGKRHGLTLKEYEANVYSSCRYALEVLKKGHNVFVPNLYHFVSEECDNLIPEEKWLELVCEWLRFCDALLVAKIPLWESSGVYVEIQMAETMGIPVYWSLEEVPNGTM